MKYSILRKISQILIIFLFITQFYLIGYGITIITGSLLSSKILGILPLVDLYASIEKIISYRSMIVFYPLAFLVTLAIYFTLGRFFCGWFCPVDLICSVEKSKEGLIVKNKKLYALPIIFFIMLLLSYLVGIPVYTNYLHPLTMSSILMIGFGTLLVFSSYDFSKMFYAVLIIVSILFVDILFGKRIWCKRLCPTGVIYGLFNKVSRLRIRVNSEECIYCGQCDKVCPTGIPIISAYIRNKLDSIRNIDCIKCLECVEVCPRKALELEVM